MAKKPNSQSKDLREGNLTVKKFVFCGKNMGANLIFVPFKRTKPFCADQAHKKLCGNDDDLSFMDFKLQYEADCKYTTFRCILLG